MKRYALCRMLAICGVIFVSSPCFARMEVHLKEAKSRLSRLPHSHSPERVRQCLRTIDASRDDRQMVATLNFRLGTMYFKARRYREAVAAFMRAAPRGRPFTWLGLGISYLELGQTSQAIDAFREGGKRFLEVSRDQPTAHLCQTLAIDLLL